MEQKKLDLNSIIGFILIFGILIWIMYQNQPDEKQVAAEKAKKDKQPVTKVRLIEDVLVPIFKQHNFDDATIKKIIPNALALFIPDVLVDMNITHLAKHAIPDAMKNSDFRQLAAEGFKHFVQYSSGGKAEFFNACFHTITF